MLCNLCKKKNATVHLTEQTTGARQPFQHHLCDECAQKNGVHGLTEPQLMKLLARIRKDGGSADAGQTDPK
jgi:protein-arginine kinase activator protein McsA